MKPKLLIATNTAWNLVNFRANLIRSLANAGFEVVAVSPPDRYVDCLRELGCRYVPLPMDNKGTDPYHDLTLFVQFFKLLRAERPDVFLGYTVKPNVYGSIAAHALSIPVINNIAGLGTAFVHDGWLNRVVVVLYRLALSRSRKVFFQNDEDLQMFVANGLVDVSIVDRMPGSGIDLDFFRPVALPGRAPIRFVLIARLIWDKGVGEFVEAARLLKKQGIAAECCLLGFLDVKNPSAITKSQMDAWVAEGGICYRGVTDNVRDEIAQADCIVLPSYYREGTPRSLLEAAAMARPIITTDSVGCRNVVDDGVSGFLCRPRNAEDLTEKMAMMAAMTPSERAAMGLRGREKVEREFDEKVVIRKYLDAIQAIVQAG